MSILDEKYTNYKKHKEKCPVCGHENTRAYITEEYYTVENFYICDNCSYFEYMCYSKPLIGILDTYDKRYDDRVHELDIEIVPPSFFNHLMW